jgi:hypothetical protein
MLVSFKKYLTLTDRAKEYEITKCYVKLKLYNKLQPIKQWLDN